MTADMMLAAALGYAARGWPVFPCRPGHKTPLTAHGVLDATTDPDQIRAWWTATPDANIGIATGAPGPDVIDFDVTPGSEDYQALTELTAAGLLAGNGGIVRTRSGGYHVYFAGSSQRNGSIRARHVDFRGQGGYVIAPPSWVAADDKPGGHYTGDPMCSNSELDWLIVKDLLDPPPPFQQPSSEPSSSSTDRPGDDYASRHTWPDILAEHGWRQIRQIGEIRYWCRPGKKGNFISASTRDNGGLWVFTTSTEFQPEQLYTKLGAYTLLGGFGEDYRAAAAQLRRDGYGDPEPAITFTQPQQPADGQPGDSSTAMHSSWYPRDLGPILDGDAAADPLPAFLTRDDGKCLIYRAKINAFIGESESGKTWAALVAVAEALCHGQQVLYLDFEDAAPGIVSRLLALGASPDQIRKQFRYSAPDERITSLARADLGEVLTDPAPDLIIVDGVNAAMTLLGLNLKDNKDATEFSQQVLRPLKLTGAAVLTIDHVTKSAEGRGSYAIGAQAKRADIDGSAIIVEAVTKFGRGQQGKLKLIVSKDRPGHVRAIAKGAVLAGWLILSSHDDGTITTELRAPDTQLPGEERQPFRPTWYMQRVSEFVELQPDGAGQNDIKRAGIGNYSRVLQAIGRLVAEGYFEQEQAGQRTINRSVKPYREVTDPTSSHQFPTGSDQFREPVSERDETGSRTGSLPRNEVTGDRSEPVALAAANPAVTGSCARCFAPMIKYGPGSTGTLCGTCRATP